MSEVNAGEFVDVSGIDTYSSNRRGLRNKEDLLESFWESSIDIAIEIYDILNCGEQLEECGKNE